MNEDQWLTAEALDGEWTPTRDLPKAFASIPVAPAFEAIHAALPPPEGRDTEPTVIVASEPTEGGIETSFSRVVSSLSRGTWAS